MEDAKAKLYSLDPEELVKEYERKIKEVERLLAAEHRMKKDDEDLDQKIGTMKRELIQFENIDQTKKEIEKQKHASEFELPSIVSITIYCGRVGKCKES